MPSRLRRYDVPGHTHFWTISCYRRLGFFHDDGVKNVVVEGLKLLQREFKICLVGYVVMPDHVHVLIYPHAPKSDDPIPISALLHAFKTFVGREAKARLRDVWRQRGRLWSAPLDKWAHGEFNERDIWTTRGHDRNIYQEKALRTRLDYCHKNPITRGLVKRAEDWPWSSIDFMNSGTHRCSG